MKYQVYKCLPLFLLLASKALCAENKANITQEISKGEVEIREMYGKKLLFDYQLHAIASQPEKTLILWTDKEQKLTQQKSYLTKSMHSNILNLMKQNSSFSSSEYNHPPEPTPHNYNTENNHGILTKIRQLCPCFSQTEEPNLEEAENLLQTQGKTENLDLEPPLISDAKELLEFISSAYRSINDNSEDQSSETLKLAVSNYLESIDPAETDLLLSLNKKACEKWKNISTEDATKYIFKLNIYLQNHTEIPSKQDFFKEIGKYTLSNQKTPTASWLTFKVSYEDFMDYAINHLVKEQITADYNILQQKSIFQ